MKTSNASDLAKRIRQRGQIVTRAVQSSIREVAEEASKYSDTLMRGTTSRKQLRKMGHPFAVRHFHAGGSSRGAVGGTLSLLPINAQSSRLRRSRRLLTRRVGKGSVTHAVLYTEPYARYVLSEKGTRKMKARGFKAAVRRHVEPIINRRVPAAFRRAHLSSL